MQRVPGLGRTGHPLRHPPPPPSPPVPESTPLMFGQPLARYVVAVVVGGCLCLAALIATGGLDLLDARHPELLVLLMGCAVVAELTPLKVVLRAAEGEITASNTFAFALLICYGAAPAAIAFALGTNLADGIRRKPPERIAFNDAQYVITV